MDKNYYGSLCTEMYEILHAQPPQDELEFYLSYAKIGQKLFEPLCGNGRFMIPFIEKGFDIIGADLSNEMLDVFKKKMPSANVVQCDIEAFNTEERFDYIFIPSGSVSLFTDIEVCKRILVKMKNLLSHGGKFVFAVDTIVTKCPDDEDYKVNVSVKTKQGFDLVLKGKNFFDKASKTQYSPSVYELWNGERLLQSEKMDFQIHLYEFGEMEEYLHEAGFNSVKTYSTYNKDIATDNNANMFLFECTV